MICSSLFQETGQYMEFMFVGVLAFGARTGVYKSGAKYRIFNHKAQYTAKEQECTQSGKSTFMSTLLSTYFVLLMICIT